MGFSLDEMTLKKNNNNFICVCRTYCETDIDPAHRKLTQLQAVVRYLTGKEPDLQCKWAHKCHHPLFLWKHTWLQCPSRSATIFSFLWLCLDRWCDVVATNTVWCCGHSSNGGLLDCPHAQHIWVDMNTITHFSDFSIEFFYFNLCYVFPF